MILIIFNHRFVCNYVYMDVIHISLQKVKRNHEIWQEKGQLLRLMIGDLETRFGDQPIKLLMGISMEYGKLVLREKFF